MKTVRRDLNALIQLGVPIEREPQRQYRSNGRIVFRYSLEPDAFIDWLTTI